MLDEGTGLPPAPVNCDFQIRVPNCVGMAAHPTKLILTSGSIIGTIKSMSAPTKILEQMRREPGNVRFNDLMKVCETYFGKARQGKQVQVMPYLKHLGRVTLV